MWEFVFQAFLFLASVSHAPAGVPVESPQFWVTVGPKRLKVSIIATPET